MSSMIHGIRILSKEDRILTFKTYLIYSDWNSLPRTHGFGLLILEDSARETGNENCSLAKEMKNYDFIDDNYALAQKILSKMEVTEFQNFPLTEEFQESIWHYIDDKTGKFHAEEFLPQAIYTLEVSDAKWLEHMKAGDVWETTSCDLDGPSWYLKLEDEKSRKFYHIYEKSGTWKILYGKLGTAGREESSPWMNVNHAETKAKEKMRKGYELIYRNFDTPYGYEASVSKQAEVKAKEDAKPEGNDELLQAAASLDIEAVKRILESGVNPNECKDKYDHPVLESVADAREVTEKHLEIAKLLLAYGADPNLGNYGPFLPSVCYMNRSEEMIRLLLEKGADITLPNSEGTSVLQSASLNGMIWLAKAALEKGVDAKYKSQYGHTALHYAAEAQENAVETVDLLLAHGAELNDCNGEWGTPLFWAAGRGGKVETINHMVKLGAQVNFKTPKGESPIHGAAQYGSAVNLKALVELGADISVPNSKGLPVMHIIAERLLGYSPEISAEAISKIEFLLQKGYQLHENSENGTFNGNLISKIKSSAKLKAEDSKILFRLLELGLDPFEADSKGFSIVHLAAKINDIELLKACLAKSGNLDIQDESGWSALHYAVAQKVKDCEQILLDAGIDADLKSKRKKSHLKVNVPAGLTAKEVKRLY